ncbi:MAG: hypothetical protein IPK52_19935 [Chloroflexi bacterium]|nr:hypothetical protein [Chloroflexota bacterium]
MSHFSDALAALAALTVDGVLDNFAIERAPGQPDRAQLPALIVTPAEREDRHFPARGEGLHTPAFSQAGATYTASITHLLLIAPQGSSLGARSHWPALAALIDAYFEALNGDPLLDGALVQPPQVVVDSGVVTYGGIRYVGAAFRHLWTLAI